MFLVIDIGCIECGEPTNIVGVFKDESTAKTIRERCIRICDTAGHYFDIFPIPEPEKLNKKYSEIIDNNFCIELDF